MTDRSVLISGAGIGGSTLAGSRDGAYVRPSSS